MSRPDRSQLPETTRGGGGGVREGHRTRCARPVRIRTSGPDPLNFLIMSLAAACLAGNVDNVRVACEAGADGINERDDVQGQTPLMVASSLGNVEIVWILLEHGADISRRDSGGKTALDLAVRGTRT